MRHINQRTEAHIKDWEKLKLKAYPDSGGKWTIGWGHTGPDVHQGSEITEERAEQLFKLDIEPAEERVDTLVKVPLGDNQFGALVSLCFNIGACALGGSTLVRLLNEKHYEEVPHQIARWNKSKNRATGLTETNKGLVNRRAGDIALWNTPDNPKVTSNFDNVTSGVTTSGSV